MVNASTAFANTSTMPTLWPQRAPSFFWVMIALSVVDLFLLFWILNPLARHDSSVRLTASPVETEEVGSGQAGDKPSPFGPVYIAKAATRHATAGR